MRCKCCDKVAHLPWNPKLRGGVGDWDYCSDCRIPMKSQPLPLESGEVEHYLLIDEED